MIIIQALLIAIAANLASGRVWSPITWPFCYPLINGTVVGLILGTRSWALWQEQPLTWPT